MSSQPRNGQHDDGDGNAEEAAARSISTAELFGTAREVLIRHDGDTYRLRITRAGKLILNK